MSLLHGKCHCGQLQWTVTFKESKLPGHILCHCDTCKILGGGAFSCNQIVHKSAISITKGEPKVYTYKGDSGKSVNCYFCGNCTTHAYHHQELMGDDIVVRTAPTAEGKNLEVAMEIYGKARYPWQKEVAKTFPTMPS
ncbi:hypothetical protein RUND412_000595 [Rhizina undulata]